MRLELGTFTHSENMHLEVSWVYLTKRPCYLSCYFYYFKLIPLNQHLKVKKGLKSALL